MMRWKKTIGLTMLLCGLGFGQLMPLETMAAGPAVSDKAGILQEAEVTAVEQAVAETVNTTSWEIFAITTDDARGMSASEYAEDYLNEFLDGDDGVAYLIDMDNREVYVATTGEPIYYLTDDRIEDIIDAGYDNVVNGFYADAFVAMLDETQDMYGLGIPSDQYTYDEDTGEITYYNQKKHSPIFGALVGAVLAVITFCTIFFGVIGRYRLKIGGYKYDYKNNSKVNITVSEDRHIRENITHRHIDRSSGSSGGGSRSSVHSGAGGRSYGGGGRKF